MTENSSKKNSGPYLSEQELKELAQSLKQIVSEVEKQDEPCHDEALLKLSQLVSAFSKTVQK